MHRELDSHYSIAIIPFILVGCIQSIDSIQSISFKQHKRILYFTIVLSLIAFIGYSRIGYFSSRYFPRIAEAYAFHDVRKSISSDKSVLTNDNYISHLSSRYLVSSVEATYLTLDNYDYVVFPGINNQARIGGKLRPVIASSLEPQIQKALQEANEVGMKCSSPNEFIRICTKR